MRFFGNLIFSIIARMLCGNQLNLMLESLVATDRLSEYPSSISGDVCLSLSKHIIPTRSIYSRADEGFRLYHTGGSFLLSLWPCKEF